MSRIKKTPSGRGSRRLVKLVVPDGEQNPMIIDCHGHYTTVPEEMQTFRQAQLAQTKDPSKPAAVLPHFSDDHLRETLEGAQLKLLRDRGIDVTIFSPRASAM